MDTFNLELHSRELIRRRLEEAEHERLARRAREMEEGDMTDRPTPLNRHEIAELLRAGPTLLRAALAALPPGAAGWHRSPAEWCANEVLGHLVQSEREDFAGRIRLMLDRDEPH